MNARERLAIMIRTNRGNMTVWSQPEVRDALDAYRAEVLAKAVGRLRAVPINCTALTGPVWYGNGWTDAIRTFEEIADYQKPDDEAYPGELQRLRALALAVRVGIRKDSLDEVKRVMGAHQVWEDEATNGSGVPDFFQPGRTYAREHHASTIRFLVKHISDSPDGSYRVAFGWRVEDGDVTWSPFDSEDFEGWTEITEAEEGR